jgi:uncharacterized radical SAM superfamily Fe-S cluster-containing enzyme
MASTARKLQDTSSLCVKCKQGIPAQLVESEGRVLMRKTCPEHGDQEVLIASDAAWYRGIMAYPAALKAPAVVKNEVKTGCPFDCGACTSHQQAVYLPVIPITSACNLDCPICYTINKNQGAFHMSAEEFGKILAVIQRNDPNMKIINLTGGEPTRHPELTRIVRMCHDAGIHRVTISTHGLTLLKDKRMLEELAELRARIVLSFDSFDEKTNKIMLGAPLLAAKMRVLDQLEKYDIDTTLIPVLALGVNDHEVGKLVSLALERECIRSLEIHTMTFTGQGGVDFDGTTRITVPDVLRRIEESTWTISRPRPAPIPFATRPPICSRPKDGDSSPSRVSCRRTTSAPCSPTTFTWSPASVWSASSRTSSPTCGPRKSPPTRPRKSCAPLRS